MPIRVGVVILRRRAGPAWPEAPRSANIVGCGVDKYRDGPSDQPQQKGPSPGETWPSLERIASGFDSVLCLPRPCDKYLARALEPSSAEKVGKSGPRKLRSRSAHGPEQN